MSDPSIAAILKKLLSLDTPVARRIFEIALLVGLIWFCSYVGERNKGKELVEFAANLVEVFGGLILFAMLAGLVVTILADVKNTLPPAGGKK